MKAKDIAHSIFYSPDKNRDHEMWLRHGEFLIKAYAEAKCSELLSSMAKGFSENKIRFAIDDRRFCKILSEIIEEFPLPKLD